MSCYFALALFAMPIVATIAEAQTVERPPRVTRAPQTAGTTSSLTVGTNIFGGYDRNLIPAGAQLAPNVTFDPSTFRGWGAAKLQYDRTSGARSLTAGGGVTASTNRNSASPGTVYGTNANLRFSTSLGQSTTLSLSEAASRTPYYSQGLFATAPPGSYSPDTNPINGIVDGYLLSLASSAAMGFSMTRHTTASLLYTYSRSMHEGGFTSDTSYRNHSGLVSLSQQIGRIVSVQSSYHAATYGGDQANFQYNSLSQGFTLGFARTQPISRTRTLEMRAGGGADLIADRGASRYWQPTYYAGLATDIARSWSLSSDYRQTSWVLTSPLSAPDSYLNQTLSFSAGGNLQRDLDLTLFTAATRGEVAAAHSTTATKGHYTGLNSGAQLSLGLGNGWSAVFGANYYRSELSGAAKQFLLTSGVLQRTSMRLGFSWNAPLFGLERRARSAGDR